jgi:oxidoreductase AflX
MPFYAVMGATGNTGQSLLNILSQSPDNSIHAYVRSKSKLLRLSPELSSAKNVKIFEGDLEDVDLICNCISGTRAVLMAIAMSDNMSGCRIAQDTARVVVAAMEKLRSKDANVKLPRVIVLSSASLDDYLCRDLPHFVHWMLLTCASNVYADLIKAEEYLRSQESWITSVFIKPGGLVHDKQKGHALSTERQQTFLSFLDLAAGMVEVADTEGDKWDMKNVSVLPTAKDVKIEWMAPINLVKGLLCHFFPSTYPWLKS